MSPDHDGHIAQAARRLFEQVDDLDPPLRPPLLTIARLETFAQERKAIEYAQAFERRPEPAPQCPEHAEEKHGGVPAFRTAFEFEFR